MDRKVVEFRLGTADISAIRFGISPGHELVHAVRAVLRPQVVPLHWGWFRTLRDEPAGEGFRLMAVITGVDGYMPDFLTADPSGDMTPEEELQCLRQVPDERLRSDLQKMVIRSSGARQQEIRELIADPAQARTTIVTRRCFVLDEPPTHPTIFYPAHGISETWHRPTSDVLDALTALLGSARARLVMELQQPLSTSECAQLTGLAASTVSHHLTVLRNAGLVDSRRAGTRVLHTRTPLSEALAGGH